MNDEFELALPIQGFSSPTIASSPDANAVDSGIAMPLASDQNQTSHMQSTQNNLIRGAGGVAGASVGLGRGLIKTAANIKNQLSSGQQAQTALQQLLSRELPPPTGPMSGPAAGGKGTQNWAKAFGMADPEALRARDMAEAHKMRQTAMAAEDKIRAMSGGSRYQIIPERASLMLDQSQIPQKVLTFSEKLSQLAASHPELMRYLLLGGRGLSSVLGGVGAASEGLEAAEQAKAGNTPAAALAGLSALSSGIGAIAPSTLPITAPLSLGIMAGRAIGETGPVRRGIANVMEMVSPLSRQ